MTVDEKKHTAFHAVVSGRVQLVMYRDFVQRKATKLGLVGSVRNVNDGTVSVTVEGEKVALEKLIAYLEKGSLLSLVESVAVEWREPTGNFSSFSIIYK